MSIETKHTNCATMGVISTLKLRLVYLRSKKASFEKLKDDEYYSGEDGQRHYNMILCRLEKSIADCEADLRKVEKEYYGV